MKNYLISVLITNYNTLDFVKLSLYALKKLTKNSYKVLINDNGSKRHEITDLQKIQKENSNIFVNFRNSNKESSFAHAEALDLLIEMVDTPYTAILDSDCTFLIKNWDDILIRRLNETTKIIGTQIASIGTKLKPNDFPFQFAVLFETEVYKKLDISCMPRDISKGEDTCWEWKPKFESAGYKGEILIAKNTRMYKKGPFSDVICAEYYIEGEKNIIASHFGRGSSYGKSKYLKHLQKIGIPFLGIIQKYLGEKEKQKWLNICYKIINGQ